MRYCVFCGSSSGVKPVYLEAAKALGRTMAEQNIGLVYGGARVGLMGAVADAALDAGGEVVGVIPEALKAVEIAHDGLTELHVTPNMHSRKALMADLSDGFIAMPGGIGTLEELFEIWTWAQLGFHGKPVALYNIDGFFDSLHGFLDQVSEQGFVKPSQREMLINHDTPGPLLEALADYQPFFEPKWQDMGERR